jgi:phosphatidylglycerophosphatase A
VDTPLRCRLYGCFVPQSGSKIALFLATGAGVGYLPYCPGTFGTFIAIPLSLFLNQFAANHLWLAIAGLTVLTAVSIWSADKASRHLNVKDPQTVVIDEIVGFVLASFLTTSWLGLIISFGLFRFFDITKIFPARRLEDLPGGAGIVLDDMMAGLYTFMILRLLSWTGII